MLKPVWACVVNPEDRFSSIKAQLNMDQTARNIFYVLYKIEQIFEECNGSVVEG